MLARLAVVTILLALAPPALAQPARSTVAHLASVTCSTPLTLWAQDPPNPPKYMPLGPVALHFPLNPGAKPYRKQLRNVPENIRGLLWEKRANAQFLVPTSPKRVIGWYDKRFEACGYRAHLTYFQNVFPPAPKAGMFEKPDGKQGVSVFEMKGAPVGKTLVIYHAWISVPPARPQELHLPGDITEILVPFYMDRAVPSSQTVPPITDPAQIKRLVDAVNSLNQVRWTEPGCAPGDDQAQLWLMRAGSVAFTVQHDCAGTTVERPGTGSIPLMDPAGGFWDTLKAIVHHLLAGQQTKRMTTQAVCA